MPGFGADDDDEEEAAVAAGVGADKPLPVVPGEEAFFLKWKRKFSSSSSAAEVTAFSDLGVPKRMRGREAAGLFAEPLAGVFGVFGVRGAGDVKTLESSRWGVPTVKSSSKEYRLEDFVRRCSKAL